MTAEAGMMLRVDQLHYDRECHHISCARAYKPSLASVNYDVGSRCGRLWFRLVDLRENS